MSVSDPPPREQPPSDQLPRHTTPTWEVELLISGVAVFAMLQLPGWMDDKLFALSPRFDADWIGALQTMYIYLKGAAIILAVTFALHLMLRAHWIALVGMHSIYPDGVRWEKLRMGPLRRAAERHRYDSAEVSIERSDNRATTVFAIGVILATTLLVLGVVAVLLFAAAIALTAVTGVAVDPGLVFTLLFLLLVLPMVIANVVDRRFGTRVRQDTTMQRGLAAVFAFYTRIGMGRGSHAMALLSSHRGQRRIGALILIIFVTLFSAVTFDLSTLKSPQRLGNYTLFPHTGDMPGDRSVDAAHYDDQRDLARDPAVPYVQSAVISGPYLQLVVPYQPRRDTPALRRTCPGALALADQHARAANTLDCLARLHAASLDGKPLAALHYDAGSDARTDRPALQAMIDVRALAPGRHVLRVERASTPADDDSSDKAAADVIVFWR